MYAYRVDAPSQGHHFPLTPLDAKMKKTFLALVCAIGASPALALTINFTGYENDPFFGTEQLKILNQAASQYENRIMDDVVLNVTLTTDLTRPITSPDALAQGSAYLSGGNSSVANIVGGLINFNVGGSFSTGASFSDFDLYTLTLHELGHVFGISGGFAPWTNQLTNGGTYFSGKNAVDLYGGLVPISSDGAHWDDTRWNLGSGILEPVMFPRLAPGQVRELTELDFAALADIGWKVSASNIPEPETWAMLLVGLGIVGNIAAKRRRQA